MRKKTLRLYTRYGIILAVRPRRVIRKPKGECDVLHWSGFRDLCGKAFADGG